MAPTTVAVSTETRDALRDLGSKGESYDAIIRRLIADAAIVRADTRWNRIHEEDEFIPLDDL